MGDRSEQQDQVALLSHPRAPGCVMVVLADGMGGRRGGRLAADQVMLTARQLFEGYAPATDSAATLLQQLVTQAHTMIRLMALASEQEPHSTVAAFILNPAGDCHWVHAGDSRIYHSATAPCCTAPATTRMCSPCSTGVNWTPAMPLPIRRPTY